MKKTWGHMQKLVAKMTSEGPKACGTLALEDRATPVRVAPLPEEVRPVGIALEESGQPSDLIGMPNLASLMSTSDLLALNTSTLQSWKSAMPERLLIETPPVFRLPKMSLWHPPEVHFADIAKTCSRNGLLFGQLHGPHRSKSQDLGSWKIFGTSASSFHIERPGNALGVATGGIRGCKGDREFARASELHA